MRLGLAALGDINTIAQTIQKIEGWFPGSLSYRNNNPGNLTYAGQPGATAVQVCNPSCHTFAQFSSYDAGYQALLNQINLDASRGETVADFTAKYAPAADANDPASYAAQLAAAAGVSTADSLANAISGSSDVPSLTDIFAAADSGSSDSSGGGDSGTTLLSGLGSIDTATLVAGGVLAGVLLLFALRS